jgi:SagB-type dehydrogenase family enzyme
VDDEARTTTSDRLYHLDSSAAPERTVDAGDPAAAPHKRRIYVGAPRLDLPGRGEPAAMPLGEALGRRRSRRDFDGGTLPLATLGRLLAASFAVVDDRTALGPEAASGAGGATGFRPSPSAGGLYPLELYVAARGVEGLDDGLYHYDPWVHQLERRRRGTLHGEIAALCFGQGFLAASNLLLSLSGVVERTCWKYGPRGYRYVCFEAGHVAQNLMLVAEALGLATVAVGGFFDQAMAELLELPEGEEPLYHVAVGRSASAAGSGR